MTDIPPSPDQITTDRPHRGPPSPSAAAHVDLAGVLFIAWGVLTVLIGTSTLALGVAAAALSRGASERGGGQLAASVTAAAFTTLAVIAILWGIAHIAVGMPLRRHHARARLAALALGSIDLVLLPYGTALGLYAVWVLLREDAKRLFESG
jgi:putative Mn2+ efflux pump MntP